MAAPTRHAVDVDVLVGLVRTRAAQRAKGLSPEGMLETIGIRMDRARSLTPRVGPAITFAKRLVVRGQYHYLNDLAQQLSLAVHAERQQRRRVADEVGALRREVTVLERMLHR